MQPLQGCSRPEGNTTLMACKVFRLGANVMGPLVIVHVETAHAGTEEGGNGTVEGEKEECLRVGLLENAEFGIHTFEKSGTCEEGVKVTTSD